MSAFQTVPNGARGGRVAVVTLPAKDTCLYCSDKALVKSMCEKHYRRVRAHGDPFIVKKPWGEGQKFLRSIPETDECVIWPLKSRNSNGYARVRLSGVRMGAHRAACITHHGPPPSNHHQAAHSCGVRDCVNPRHISWKTPKENHLDRAEHGTLPFGQKSPSAKLTEDNVREIRVMAADQKTKDIAKKMGVGVSAINSVLRGQTWGWLE